MSTQAAARSGEPKLLTKAGDRWLWTGGYDTRHLPKDAGFRWDAINKRWWTDQTDRAGKLIRYATDPVRTELEGKAEDMVATLEASRAVDADLDVPVPDGLRLFPFQRAGVAFILRKFASGAGRVILGDDMGCVDGAAIVAVNRAGKGFRITLRDLYLRFHGMAPRGGKLWDPEIPTYCRALCDDELRQHRIVDVLDKEVRETIRVMLTSGKSICLTPDHEVATPFGFRPAETLRPGHQVLTNGQPACSRCDSTDGLVTYEKARFFGMCRRCIYRHARSHPRKKGRTIDTDGYARLCGHHDHSRANKGGQVYEHVLLVEQRLGRPLDWPREQVHHLNGDRADNRLENLIIVNPSDHHRAHGKHRHMDGGKGGRGGLVRFVPIVDQVVSVESAGPRRVYDVVMEDPHRNFVADGVVVHNCGKTPQAICSVNALPTVRSVLVICPASLKLNWLREWQRWSTRDLSASIATAQVCADTDVVIVNYDCFSRRSKTAERLKARHFDLLILDEFHALQDAKTHRTKEIFGYWRTNPKEKVPGIQATHVLALSGTPIRNKPIELWPTLHYLDPQTWRSWKFYVERFCAGYQDGWGWKVDGASNLDELQRRMRSTLLIRRRKSEVLTELPPIMRQLVEVSTDGVPGAREAVDAEVTAWDEREETMSSMRAEIEQVEQGSQAYEEAVAKLRMAYRAAFTEIARLRHDTAVAKVPAVIEHLRSTLEDSDEPVIVWAHHHDVVDGIKAGLEPDYSVVILTGRETIEQKQAAVDAFQAGKARVFIGSITAAGVGLTLTAASRAVFAELDWVPGNVSQCEARCHRIGTRSSVLVQHVVLDGSLDARMAKTIVAKQAVLDATLDSPTPRELREWLPKVLWPDFGLDVPTAPGTGQTSGTADTAEGKPQAGQDQPGTSQETHTMTPEQVAAIHAGLRLLAQLDPDGARDRNDMGFNGRDVEIGHSLAEAPRLSQKQAVLGRKILRKYRRTQLPPEVVAAIGYEEEEAP